MPESIPASLIIDTLKDTFREARAERAAEGWGAPACGELGWILSVPDTHQKTVLAALDKEQALRVVTCATEDEATAIAQDLVTRTTVGGTNPNGNSNLTGPQPLANIADLVGKWTVGTSTTTPIIGSASYDGFSADLGNYTVGTPGSNLIERFRETTMRALSDAGQAGTWNLMIDVVAQSGRYTTSSRTLADFLVEGERHYWVHVAIDRQTGKIIDENVEVVNE